MNKKRRYFFDMDGVLAYWRYLPLEIVTQAGYFSSLSPEKKFKTLIKLLIEAGEEVFVLSSVFQDKHSETEKNLWLDREFPLIPPQNRIFVPYGESKSLHLLSIFGTLDAQDVIVDDFTWNLNQWHGIAVKYYNGINGKKGTWLGSSIHYKMKPEDMFTYLTQSIFTKQKEKVNELCSLVS